VGRGAARRDVPPARRVGPDREFEYTETTQQGNAWSRPFFIEGVSGLGPVDYHVLEFTVSVSGLYSFESVLASGGDHWTCLYKGDFVELPSRS
jgi:hypothetical protein